MEKRIRIHASLTPQVHKELEHLIDRDRIPASYVVERAIHREYNRLPKTERMDEDGHDA